MDRRRRLRRHRFFDRGAILKRSTILLLVGGAALFLIMRRSQATPQTSVGDVANKWLSTLTSSLNFGPRTGAQNTAITGMPYAADAAMFAPNLGKPTGNYWFDGAVTSRDIASADSISPLSASTGLDYSATGPTAY